MIKEKIIFGSFIIIISLVVLEFLPKIFPALNFFLRSDKINIESNIKKSDQNNTEISKPVSLFISEWGSDIFHDRSNVYNNWFQLTGITQFENNYKAIINGEILMEMDRVRGFTVKKITGNKVVLKRNEYIVTLKLEK